MGTIKRRRGNARGKRGQALENLIELAAMQYRRNGIARIDKVPTPMTQFKGKTFRQAKSTVDFTGTIKGGRSVAFDAKATNEKTRFDICNETHVLPHQVEYLKETHQLGGIAFLLVEFAAWNEQYVIPYPVARKYLDRGAAGGRKSISYDEMKSDPDIKKVEPGPGIVIHFLRSYLE